MSQASGVLILFVGLAMLLPMVGGGPSSSRGQAAASPGKLPRGADLVLLHGKIWTGEPAAKPSGQRGGGPVVEAVAIADGRFFAAGSNDEMQAYVGPGTQVIDLQGRLAVPGFIDSHVHFVSGGFQLLQLDLKNAKDEGEFTRRIAE